VERFGGGTDMGNASCAVSFPIVFILVVEEA